MIAARRSTTRSRDLIFPTAVETEVLERVVRWFEAGRPEIDGLSTAPAAMLRCPSASNSHGDEVFAVFDDADNEIRFLPEPIDVPDVLGSVLDLDEFAAKNRLAGWCLTSGCEYWQSACRLGHLVNQVTVSVRPTPSACAIIDTCRWRREQGVEVCGPCAAIRNLPLNLQTRPDAQAIADGRNDECTLGDAAPRGCP